VTDHRAIDVNVVILGIANYDDKNYDNARKYGVGRDLKLEGI